MIVIGQFFQVLAIGQLFFQEIRIGFCFQVMVIGQFVPEQFSVLPEMIADLAPFEVMCVLQVKHSIVFC